jgi:hypothetical protein
MSDTLSVLKNIPTKTVTRVFSAAVAAGAGGILGIAMWLTPSPAGHGTHTQLGLGQCTFLTFTGYPCPMCGMTTTFAYLAHLHPLSAVVTQPFGLVLFSMTVGAFAIGVAEVVQPRDRWTRLATWLAPYESMLAALFLAGMGAGWIYKIVLMKVFGGG